MNIESNLSGHWTDEQLIASIYDAGPSDGHAAGCSSCQSRLIAMKASRERTESLAAAGEVPVEFLQAQRRRIYQKVTQPVKWWTLLQARRWASGAAALLLVGGGLFLYEHGSYEHNQPQAVPMNTLSDAQLAQDVRQMSDNDEALPTAPVQALFE